MKILNNSNLSYSLNVYDINSIEDIRNICNSKVEKFRKNINAKQQPFALGLWINAQVAKEFQQNNNIDKFKGFLKEQNYFVSSINAFPFGDFQNKIIKSDVYLPDWSELARLEYTLSVIDILSHLLPEKIEGSISTLPGGYKKFWSEDKDEKMLNNILKVGEYLLKIYKTTGKKIILSYEMEPDCVWENIQDFVSFYNKFRENNRAISEFIGVCYDTCHQEIVSYKSHNGIDLILANNIPIGKIQFSAALSINDKKGKDKLKELGFLQSIYLHQVASIAKNGDIRRYSDLSDSIEIREKLLIHYHIPIFLEKVNENIFVEKSELLYILEKLKSKQLYCINLEIETYTYSLLKNILDLRDIEHSIAKEYQWIIEKL